MRKLGQLLALEFTLCGVQVTAQPEPAVPNPNDSSSDLATPAGPILLARTPVAPLTALGSATFLSGFGSTNAARLSLELRGFAPGHYQLGIVRRSDQTFVPLAKFSIADPTAGPDRDTAQNTKTTTNGRQSQELVSQNVILLPRLADPRDVAKLAVADDRGNYLLVGDFHPGKPEAGGR